MWFQFRSNVVISAVAMVALLVAAVIHFGQIRQRDDEPIHVTDLAPEKPVPSLRATDEVALPVAGLLNDESDSSGTRAPNQTASNPDQRTERLPSGNPYGPTTVAALVASMNTGSLTSAQRKDYHYLLNSPWLSPENKVTLWRTSRALIAQGKLRPAEIFGP